MKTGSKSKQSTPSTFQFDSLEDQTSHALHILRALERMCEGEQNFEIESEDLEAVAGLLFQARMLLEPLDLQGVAGALETKKFTIAQAGESGRPTIACAKCSQEKGGLQ